MRRAGEATVSPLTLNSQIMDALKRLLQWMLYKLERPSFNPDEPRQGRRRLTRKDIDNLIKLNGGSAGIDLTSCDLTRLDLRGMYLRGARISDSHFYLTDLSGSVLGNCDLRNTNFHDTNLNNVDLYLADLENAHLVGASLHKANLNRANITNARLPDNIRQAIGDRLIQENENENNEYLTRLSERIPENSLIHRRAFRFIEAANIYGALKNNLMSSGRYKEASWAYIRERQMRKKSSNPRMAIITYRALEPADKAWAGSSINFYFKSFVKWVSDWLAELSCGYGERPLLTIIWAVAIVFLFALLFQWTGGITSTHGQMTFLHYLNYSLGAFTTMGYDQYEAVTLTAQTLTSSEALLGISILALLMFALGNRISRS